MHTHSRNKISPYQDGGQQGCGSHGHDLPAQRLSITKRAQTCTRTAETNISLTRMEDSRGVAAMAMRVLALVIITLSGMSHCNSTSVLFSLK
jgi:hypothetical protein